MTKNFSTNKISFDSAKQDPENEKRDATFVKLIPILNKTASVFIKEMLIGVNNHKEIVLQVTLKSNQQNLLSSMKKFILACGRNNFFSCSESSESTIIVSIKSDKLNPISATLRLKKLDFKNFSNIGNQVKEGDSDIQNLIAEINDSLNLDSREGKMLSLMMKFFITRHEENVALKEKISKNEEEVRSFREKFFKATDAAFVKAFGGNAIDVSTSDGQKEKTRRLTAVGFKKLIKANL